MSHPPSQMRLCFNNCDFLTAIYSGRYTVRFAHFKCLVGQMKRAQKRISRALFRELNWGNIGVFITMNKHPDTIVLSSAACYPRKRRVTRLLYSRKMYVAFNTC